MACFINDLKYEDVIQKEDVGDIWKYAKGSYIDRGSTPVEAIHGTAADLGLPREWVARAFTEPKSMRKITNEMYKTMSDRRRAISEAKDMVRGLNTPPLKKIIQTIWRTPFAVAVAGHGTVGMQTHAGAALFRPSTWGTYFKNFGRQYSYSFSKVAHEKAMQELVTRDNYILAKRSGLANDPNLTYTDYGQYAKWIPKVLGKAVGQRGFDVLKVYRQDAFDYEWSKVPESIKSDPTAAKDMAQFVAENVNHGSGVADIGHGTLSEVAQAGLFAAKLEGSRWARIIGDPIKTVNTVLNWKNASAAERHIAVVRVKHAAEFAGFYYLTLLANNAILEASGSDDRVNLTDYSRSDWLKHKVAGRTLGIEGNLIAPIRLLAQVTDASLGTRKPYQKMESRFESVAKSVGSYGRGKLSPAAGVGVDVLSQSDFMGNVMPTSSDIPKKGKHQLTYGEYAGQRGPIPLSGFIREVYDDFREQGMDAATATNLIRGFSVLGAETTGAKVGHEPQTKVTTSTSQSTPKSLAPRYRTPKL